MTTFCRAISVTEASIVANDGGKRTFIHTYIPDGSGKLAGIEAVWWAELNTLPAMSMAKGRSDFQPVYQPTTLPPDTRGRSYGRPPANPTGQTETPRVLLIC